MALDACGVGSRRDERIQPHGQHGRRGRHECSRIGARRGRDARAAFRAARPRDTLPGDRRGMHRVSSTQPVTAGEGLHGRRRQPAARTIGGRAGDDIGEPSTYFGPKGVVVGALLVGLVIFDTALVTVSRSRAGLSVLAGARDHTTHRLRQWVRTPRQVAVVLATTQLLLCAVTITLAQAGRGWVLLAGGVALVFGGALLWQFETSPRFRVERNPAETTVAVNSPEQQRRIVSA